MNDIRNVSESLFTVQYADNTSIVKHGKYMFSIFTTLMNYISIQHIVFDTFQPLYCDVLASIIHKLNRTTCGLDPFPTKLLMSHLSSIINIILRIVNLCFSSCDFPASCKSAIISPLIKKQGLDSEILKNYRHVAISN